VDRLIGITESDNMIVQETRSFDADNNTTFSLRTKEEADDYRYFPEPDLSPFFIANEFLQQTKDSIPELPESLEKKYCAVLHLPAYDAQVICSDKETVHYFEAIIKHTVNYKAAANWLLGPVKSYLNDNQIDIKAFILPAEKIAALVQLVDEGKVNFSNASTKIFNALLNDPKQSPLEIATALNLLQESDSSSVETWVDEAIAKMPDKVKEYKSGKVGLLGLFMGEVMKLSKGKADPKLANEAVKKMLEEG
jgi:aspartyl-tRNA(Asn)/glutamyl-tRNA(Gln) amidotransferase subunit B